MNFQRQQNQSKARIALMNAGAQAIIKRGYKQTSVTDICTIADYSRRTFYKYFANKDDLIPAIIGAWVQINIDSIIQSVQQYQTPTREYQFMRLILRQYQQDIAFFRAIIPYLDRFPLHEIKALEQQHLTHAIKHNKLQFDNNVAPEVMSMIQIATMADILILYALDDTKAQQTNPIDEYFRLVFKQEPPETDN